MAKHPKSLHKPKVSTDVTPDRKGSIPEDQVEKIRRQVSKEVKEAIAKNQDKPAEGQVSAAAGKVAEAQEALAVDGKNVSIDVTVTGERGEGGQTVSHEVKAGKAAKEVSDYTIDDDE